jgi:hypothetical protein
MSENKSILKDSTFTNENKLKFKKNHKWACLYNTPPPNSVLIKKSKIIFTFYRLRFVFGFKTRISILTL